MILPIPHLARLHVALTAAGVAAESITGGPAGVTVHPTNLQTAAQPTIDAFDWSEAAHEVWIASEAKVTAKALYDAQDAAYRQVRAIVKLTVDELNILRGWLTSFKAEVAAAANLTDLKNRVAALPNTPERTYTQARTAIDTLIDGE